MVSSKSSSDEDAERLGNEELGKFHGKVLEVLDEELNFTEDFSAQVSKPEEKEAFDVASKAENPAIAEVIKT